MMGKKRPSNPRLYTIGHSTRTFEEFAELLREIGIGLLVDVRSHPGSRKFPHFNREALDARLREAGIGYLWLPALGGHRKAGPKSESPNTGLTHAGFRAYADHMLTEEFREGIQRLLAEANRTPTAIMCAELLFWRCHRRLVSDYLTAGGTEVLHIMARAKLQPHALTPGAKITSDGGVIYPPSPVTDDNTRAFWQDQ